MTVLAAGLNANALGAFAAILSVTLAVTWWASRRTRTATDYWAAGRGISGAQNGFAIAGDLMSAATFLGFTGLIFLVGFDGWILAVVAITPFLLVLLLFAERMRNAGKFTVADVISFRLQERPARAAAALTTLSIALIYLIAQLVGAGVLIQALAGLSFPIAVIVTGTFMLVYVIFGGMLATTWVQIIKAVLLMTAGITMTVWVLSKVGFNPLELFRQAADRHPKGDAYLAPGGAGLSGLDNLSMCMAFVIGTAALPHILIRFFTVPDANAARSSAAWAAGLIGVFFILTSFIGFGARLVLGPAGEEAAGKGGNLAAPLLAQALGGGEGTTGGDLLLAFVSAVAFATILAVVSGLVISASGAVAHDIWTNIIRRESADGAETEEPTVARIASATIGVAAIVLAILAGSGFNVAFLVGLALSVAACANFPALLLALTWRGLTTAGAVTGMLVGLVASLALIVMSPTVWPGPDSDGSPFPLAYPTLVAMPLAFLGCWLGSMVGRERRGERSFAEMLVRSETGLGAEAGTPRAGVRSPA
jgi:cation/acetate symporter